MLPLTDIATNLLASAIWELLLHPAYRGARGLLSSRAVTAGEKSQPRPLRDESEIRPTLATSIRSAAQALAGSHASFGLPEPVWRDFLTSAEAHELLTDVFAYQIANYATGEELVVAFEALWAEFAEPRALPASINGELVIDRITAITQRLLDLAIREGVLEAHEAKSAARHRIIADRLSQIDRRLTSPGAVTSQQALAYAVALAQAVRQRHSTIEPPSLQARERVPIASLYVQPTITLRMPHGPRPLTFNEFLTTTRRRVVLGHAGAGKSTLTSWCCSTLGSSETSPTPQSLRNPVVPWRIEVRRYAAIPEGQRPALVDYFTSTAHASYAVPPVDGAFAFLLSRGSVFVIFDGLDELMNHADRGHVRDVIESFCRQYPLTPVLVTARVVGYSQAPLDHNAFDIVHIEEFAPEQVEAYARKWFSRERSLSPPEQEEKTEAFLEESASVADLRGNPLLLALMCAFYRGRGYIPNNLPDVYGSCAQLLFDTWDRQRGIVPALPFPQHIRPALTDLAYWIFTEQRLADGVTHSATVGRTARFLSRFRYADPAEAHAAAEEFVDFCRGRAWVFSDTGEVRNGEELFAFTHRTFLEFFCAEYLQLSHATPAALVDELVPRIGDGTWEVVARVALQMKARSLLDGADAVVNRLGHHLERESLARRIEIQRFILRALGALVPSPTTVSALAGSVLASVAHDTIDERKQGPAPAAESSPRESMHLLGALSEVGSEMSEQLEHAIVEALARAIEQGRAPRFAAEITFWTSDMLQAMGYAPTAVAWWERIRWRVVDEYSDTLEVLYAVDTAAALDAYAWGALPIGNLIEHHGWSALFARRPRALTDAVTRAPVPETLVAVFEPGHRMHLAAVQAVEDLDRLARRTQTPWITRLDELPLPERTDALARLVPIAVSQPAQSVCWGGVWVLAALTMEVRERTRAGPGWLAAVHHLQAQRGQIGMLADILLARRYEGDGPASVCCDALGMSEATRTLVRKWVGREVSLIG